MSSTATFPRELVTDASRLTLVSLAPVPLLLSPVLTDFIRPQFPFDCEAMGGCGPEVTARMPKTYCAIDVHRDWNTYKFGRFV
jgi:hypothetical protein